MSSIKVALLVVAAGRGRRLGAERPKQYLNCAGRPLIAHTLEALAAGWPFSAVTIVIHPDDRALYDDATAHLTPAAAAALGPPAIGGETRQQSVLAGLEALVPAAPTSCSSTTPPGPSRRPNSLRARFKPPSATARPRPERR